MLRALTVVVALCISNAALAQEPSGCDKFKWGIDRERALLGAATANTEYGPELPNVPATAKRINLKPFESAALPMPPERVPRDTATNAGYLKLARIERPGLYALSLSTNGWIDAVQNGKYLKTVAFSGATDCENIRKVVRFELTDAPLLIQVTGVGADSIAIAITPATE
jgi:hypothetical protein